MSNIIHDYPNLINVFAIVVGWWIINGQNNRREVRKEVRALLNDIQAMIGELEAESILHHTEKYNVTRRALLTFKARLMSQKVEIATQPLKVDRSKHINDFRNSIMGKNWDKHEHRLLDMDDDILKGIRQCSSDLSIQLERDFSNFYHKRWLAKQGSSVC